MRTLVIGDIHGALKSLQQCLERCSYDKEYDKLIFLGDYVDGWSETAELVDFLLDLKKQAVNEPIFLMGNHDIWCKDWFNTGIAPMIWTEQGGRATQNSYVSTGLLADKEHHKFFNSLHNWYIDEENRLFVHAGWDYLSKDFKSGATSPVNAGIGAMECHWDRSLLRGALSAFSGNHKNPRFKALEEFKEVYIGHTALVKQVPLFLGNLIALDTGCGWHGKLTIMDIDTKEYWQSDTSKSLYPNELGRT